MEIKKGDEICCLACGKSFLLDDDTFYLTPTDEIIKCPHCQCAVSVDLYHFKYKTYQQEDKENLARRVEREVKVLKNEIYRNWINYVLLNMTLDTPGRECMISFWKTDIFSQIVPVLKKEINQETALRVKISDDPKDAKYARATIKW